MFRLIIWGFLIYFAFKLVRFFNKVYSAINNAASRDRDVAQSPKKENISPKKDINNIIEADFEEIDPKVDDAAKKDEAK
jgi:hypothetical protein